MKKIIFFIFIHFNISLYAQNELKYDANITKQPEWVNLMYSEDTDIADVVNAFNIYYKNHELVKNKHTQYYKRWLRNISRFSNANIQQISKSSNVWECIGPWDFDKDANSRSYAPGSAHIYTVEQSVSNSDVLYAGSATAGAWKSIDKGNNWSLITKNLSLNTVYAIEIDYTNPDIIFISGNGGIYKSIDGGINWIIIGDASFTSLNHSVKDIKLKPSNNQELFVASNQGLFHSTNAGVNFNQIMSGNFLEIEFHPNSTDTMLSLIHI